MAMICFLATDSQIKKEICEFVADERILNVQTAQFSVVGLHAMNLFKNHDIRHVQYSSIR